MLLFKGIRTFYHRRYFWRCLSYMHTLFFLYPVAVSVICTLFLGSITATMRQFTLQQRGAAAPQAQESHVTSHHVWYIVWVEWTLRCIHRGYCFNWMWLRPTSVTSSDQERRNLMVMEAASHWKLHSYKWKNLLNTEPFYTNSLLDQIYSMERWTIWGIASRLT